MYEYHCAHCGKRFEVLQKFSDATLTVHEECGSGPVERLVSAPAFSFKGTGWYVTDYAKKNGTKGDGSSTPASSETKTESKAESKSESKSDTSSTTPATPAPAASSDSGASTSTTKSDK